MTPTTREKIREHLSLLLNEVGTSSLAHKEATSILALLDEEEKAAMTTAPPQRREAVEALKQIDKNTNPNTGGFHDFEYGGYFVTPEAMSVIRTLLQHAAKTEGE